jgi:hypothetical protein
MLNAGVPKFTEQIPLDIKAQIDPKTMIARDFNTPLPPKDMSTRPNILI